VNSTARQEQDSRLVVSMRWMDRVRSRRYQTVVGEVVADQRAHDADHQHRHTGQAQTGLLIGRVGRGLADETWASGRSRMS
jgi:hypothetical protein